MQDSQSKQNTDDTFNNPLITEDIEKAVENAQLLLSYLSSKGIPFSQPLADTIIESKFHLQRREWSPSIESKFWLTYQQACEKIMPVTVDSLRAKKAKFDKKGKRKPSVAYRAVQYYRYFSVITLFILLAMQMFWIVGNNVSQHLKETFEEREVVVSALSAKGINIADLVGVRSKFNREENHDIFELLDKHTRVNNQLNAHYALLLSWNNIWKKVLFINGFSVNYGNATSYDDYKHQQTLNDISSKLAIKQQLLVQQKDNPEAITSIKDDIQQLQKEYQRHKLKHVSKKAQQHLFVELASSNFVLTSLNAYILPLIYGLLGASIYVLRVISAEIKQSVYSHESEIKYRIRLSLGALAGMTVGWFLTPEDTGTVALSSLTVAFLTGYNVELLFSQMDRLIANFSKEGKSLRAEEEPAQVAQPQPQTQIEKNK